MFKFSSIFIFILAVVSWNGITFAAPFQFERDLYFGLRGDSDVSRLQEFLTDKGYYSGPVTGNFFSLTREAVIKFQRDKSIAPTEGYFGPKSRLVANVLTVPVLDKTNIQKTIDALMVQIQALQVQLAEARAKEEVAKIPPVPAVPVVLPPLASSLRIVQIYPSISLSRYTNVALAELDLRVDDSAEKIVITRIKFKNSGTLNDMNFSVLRLIESGTKREVAKISVLAESSLAVIGGISDGIIEFKMTTDATKIDNGLVVSGKTYAVEASLLTPNTTLVPTIKLDILSAADIDAFDANDLTRVAVITKNNVFPIEGPKITVSRL